VSPLKPTHEVTWGAGNICPPNYTNLVFTIIHEYDCGASHSTTMWQFHTKCVSVDHNDHPKVKLGNPSGKSVMLL